MDNPRRYIELSCHVLEDITDNNIKSLLSKIFCARPERVVNFLQRVDDEHAKEYLMSVYKIDESSLSQPIPEDISILYYRTVYKAGYKLELSIEVDALLAEEVSIGSNVKFSYAIAQHTGLPVLFDDGSASTRSWLRIKPDATIYEVVSYDEDDYPGEWSEEHTGLYPNEDKTKFLKMFSSENT